MVSKKSRRINIENEVIVARIYKISNCKDSKVYVGSTIKTLCKRLGDHMYDYTKGISNELYKHFSLHGIDSFKITLLECKIVKSIEEMHYLEQKWIDKESYENLLNSKRAISRELYNLFYKNEIVSELLHEIIDGVVELKLNKEKDIINE